MKINVILIVLLFPLVSIASTLNVGSGKTYSTITAALSQVKAGDTILVFPGIYTHSENIINISGTLAKPIYIISQTLHQAIYRGNSEAWHCTDIGYITISGFVFERQTGNGVNIDDGGTYITPSHHVLITNCIFRDMNATGNNDQLKLSGLDHFEIQNCQFINGSTGGSGIDMVGCHQGVFFKNYFENQGSNSIQAKGGTQFIRIQSNVFNKGGQRAINIGGSTGLQFFRPIDATFESADIDVYTNIFIGGFAPIAFVGTIRSKVINNTIIQPENWVMRILQETVDPNRFASCGDNEFSNNIIYLGNSINVVCNVGPNTRPTSFIFANNLWYNYQNPNWMNTNLPVAETNAVYKKDPLIEDIPMRKYASLATSAAKAAGKHVTALQNDYNGKLFLNPRSIGAFEIGMSTFTSELDDDNDIIVFPNPVHSDFQIIFSDNQYVNSELHIFNTNMQLVQIATCTEELTTVSIRPDLENGIYIVGILNKNNITGKSYNFQKIIVMR